MKEFPYEDIVNLKHFHDPTRPFMPDAERAAQFMPFKSLNEYEDYVKREANDVEKSDDINYAILYE